MRRHQKIINLFDDKTIIAIKHVISISDEEDLNQFWEHITTNYSGYDSPSYPFFVSLYELSERFLSKYPEQFFEIIVEQSESNYYFTIWNKTFIPFVREHWEKRGIEHLFDSKKISVRLFKPIVESKDERETRRVMAIIENLHVDSSKKVYSPYTFIEKNDLNELFTLIEDLNTHLGDAIDISFSAEILVRIRSCFSMISLILNHYEEVEEMALIMSEFSMMMNQNKEYFFKLNTDQIALIEGFVHNFERWLKVLFVHGGADISFMNRSMRADMETIHVMTHPTCELSSDNLDAIFDF